MESNKNLNKEIVFFLLPLIYAIGICLYTPPPTYDLNHFYGYYSVFGDFDLLSIKIQKVFIKSPDYIPLVWLLLLAKLNLPIFLFFLPVTYITVFNFLYIFRYIYRQCVKQNPPTLLYFIIFCSLNLFAILSGVRNIHALSFVALSFVFIHKKKYWITILLLLYAGLFHYSTYIYLLVFISFFFLLRIGWSKSKILKLQYLISIILCFLIVLVKLMPTKYLESVLPYNLFLKVDFYIRKTDIFIKLLYEREWESIFLFFLYTYSLMISFFILFYRDIKSYLIYNKYFMLVVVPCLVCVLFPNTFSRYMMLSNTFIVVYALSISKQTFKRNLIILQTLLIFGVQLYLFFKSIN
ncbi:EpsG family protein [Riemerella columbina]|uniref:EpsG family protein n=1 Tax=Riemerella columbina TaxID=103810 RepID=UPI00036BDBD3